MKQASFHNINDITIVYPGDHYNSSKIEYNGHTFYASFLEDYLWNEFQYDKYGESYEEGVVGDDGNNNEEFDAWIKAHLYLAYEWLDDAIDAEEQEQDEQDLWR